jgi:protease I
MRPIAQTLSGRRAAILVGDNFQIHEAYYPYYRLREAGMVVSLVGEEADHVYHDYGGEPLKSDMSIQAALAEEFDCVYCPGGFAPMKLRADSDMLGFAKAHFESGKLFAAICHAASFLVAMDVLRGKRATCYHTLKDDLVNAGAEYVDASPVIDQNLITARTPQDLPDFLEAIVRYLERGPSAVMQDRATRLKGKTVGILIDKRYHALQVWMPFFRLKAAGADVTFVGDEPDAEYQSRISHLPARSDCSADEASRQDFDVLIVPGDWAADKMRVDSTFLSLIQQQHQAGRLLIGIAEGQSVLISAQVLKGRRVACLPEMVRDVANSGAQITDEPVSLDAALMTARSTDDLPELMTSIIGYFEGTES